MPYFGKLPLGPRSSVAVAVYLNQLWTCLYQRLDGPPDLACRKFVIWTNKKGLEVSMFANRVRAAF